MTTPVEAPLSTRFGLSLRQRIWIPIAAAVVAQAGAALVLGSRWPFRAIGAATAALIGIIVAERLIHRPIRTLANQLLRGDSELSVDPGHSSQGRDPFRSIVLGMEAMTAAIEARKALLQDADASLRSSEARYRDLFETNPHPMVVFDTETLEIIAANDAAVRQYGYSRQQFLRMTVRHLMSGPSTDDVPSALARMGLDHESSVEAEHRRRDGVIIVVEITSNRMRFPNRNAAIAMFVDITERKLAERQNRRRTEMLAGLYEDARDHAGSLRPVDVAAGIVRTAADRLGGARAWIIRVDSEGWAAITAAHPDERLTDSWESWRISEHPRAPTTLAITNLAAVEYTFPDPSGEVAPWAMESMDTDHRECIALPLIHRGSAIGALHVWFEGSPPDFTEHGDLLASFALHASAALANADLHAHVQETAFELDRRVKERTIELEAANHELEAFSYSVSHDLRAPLRGIDGLSRLLLDEDQATLSDQARRYLSMIRCSVSEMDALIHALLDFSRSSRQDLHLKAVRPRDLVDGLVERVRLTNRNRTFEFEIGDLPECYADPTLLKQVFANLLSNAVKYTAHRSRAVIRIDGHVADGDAIYWVKDNGVGFDPNQGQRIFGVFQRLHGADEYPGTGVGLATVFRIIQRHRGGIWFDAAPGEGATFYVRLPIASPSTMTDADGQSAHNVTPI